MGEQLPPTAPRRYIVDRQFRCLINGVSTEWKPGTIIDDAYTIVTMLTGNSPISPIVNEDDLLVCPHCGKASSRQAQEGAKALLSRARQLMPGHV